MATVGVIDGEHGEAEELLAALREWELRKEEYGLDDEFLRRSYCRYVSTQEGNVEPKYIATLSTWLQPDNPKIRGY